MAPVSLERFVKQLAQLKQEMDEGKLQSSEYDQRLARAIRELREQKLDADRAAVSQALAEALRRALAIKWDREKIRASVAKFDWDVNARTVVGHLEKAIGK